MTLTFSANSEDELRIVFMGTPAFAVPLPFDPTVASPRVVDEFALPLAAGNR